MTSVKVKFTPSSVILKEGTVHYQIIHHCKVRHIRTGYKLFPSEWISASSEINVSAGSGEGRKSYLVALKNQIDLKSASNLNGNLNCSKELEHYAS